MLCGCTFKTALESKVRVRLRVRVRVRAGARVCLKLVHSFLFLDFALTRVVGKPFSYFPNVRVRFMG